MRALIALGVGSMLLAACSRPPSPARFSGRTAEPVRTAATLEERAVQPQGYDVLGRVWSHCSAPEETAELDEAWLKDVACSEELLVHALRHKAAEVGGQVLVGRQCESRNPKPGVLAVICSALVARASEEAGARTPLGEASGEEKKDESDEPFLLSAGRVTDAWRIAVDFTPVDREQAPRCARTIHLVGERRFVPVNQQRFGDVVARCRGQCEQDSVRAAVRAAAARVGAHDVAAISCVEARPGWVCTGQASVYPRIPADDPATW